MSDKKTTDPETGATPDTTPEAEADAPTERKPETEPEPAEEAAETGDDSPVTEEPEDSDAEPDAQTPEEIPDETPEQAADEPPPEQPEPAEKVVERVIETRRGGFLPAVIGGVIAALFGVAIAGTAPVQNILPDALKDQGTQGIAALRESLAEQTDALAALRDEVGALDPAPLESLPADIAALRDRAEGIAGDVAALDDRVAGLDARVTALEKAPPGDGTPGAATAAFERELAGMQALLDEQKAEVEAMVDNARALEAEASRSAEIAAARTALARIQSALDAGTGYAEAVTRLKDADYDVPEALAGPADEGVATRSALIETYAPAARDALAAARAKGSTSGSVTAFLQRHLGARSVTPREGDDADAILSRAEAAIESGRIDAALGELAALPDSARALMDEWIARAETRRAALDAAQDMLQQLNSN